MKFSSIKSFFYNIKGKINKILNDNFCQKLVDWYHQIPRLYKTTFWTVFIVLNIVFAYHTINFFWSNHEWPFMRGKVPYNVLWSVARFTLTIPYAIMGFRFLPVLLNIFGFMGLSLSTIALAYYWKLPKKISVYICFCLMVVLLPYNLIWMYHIIQTCYFWGALLIVLALEIFERKWQSRYFYLWYLLSAFLLFFTLGMSAAFVDSIFICVIGRYLIEFAQGMPVKILFKRGIRLFIMITLSLLLFKGAIAWAKYAGILWGEFYNVQHIGLWDMPVKLWSIRKYLWEQFTITYPFLDSFHLNYLLGISIVAIIALYFSSFKKQRVLKSIFICTLSIFGLLIATQLTTIISAGKGIQYWMRITGYFGHYYFYALMIAILYVFLQKLVFKNILFLASVILIAMGVQNNMYAMHVWKEGRDAEERIMNRVINRMEELDGFSYDKNYNMLLLGDFSLRKRYYDLPYKDQDVSVLGWSYRAPWETINYMNFYAPKDFVVGSYQGYWDFKFTENLLPILPYETLEFIQKEAKAWPDKNSVFIRGNTIFIFLQQDSLNEFKRIITNYLVSNPILKEKKSIRIRHPAWSTGAVNAEFLSQNRIIHKPFSMLGTIEKLSANQVTIVWDCCGREVFVKRPNGIYEYQSSSTN